MKIINSLVTTLLVSHITMVTPVSFLAFPEAQFAKTMLLHAATIKKHTMDYSDSTKSTLAAVERFNAGFNRHDVNAVMAAMTEDCIFENTNPAPDGTIYKGAAEVRAYWERFFKNNPDAYFEAEEIIATGDRCVVRWIYRKTKDGQPWHLKGVDIFKIRDGKVAEKRAYVKG